jgi:pimeloyl-ACP methyl ester carboxylesterase
MASQITPNTFLSHCARPSASSKVNTTATTILFISGNPGLISYYHPFLSLLADQLRVSKGSKPGGSFQIYGCSLGGFELLEDKVQPSNDRSHKPNPKIYGLEDQIHFVHGKLHTLVTENSKTTLSQTRSADAATPPPRQKVILIGHSVGAYIAMEILRRHRETSGSKSVEFDIIGGVMLFPTVMDIAASPSGRKLTVCICC